MSAAASATTALASYLLADSGVNTIVSGRVYRPQLDEDVDPSMPQACIVVRRAGGYQMFGGGQLPVGDPRLDIFCYGSTWLESEAVAEEVVRALRALTQRVIGHTRLYWARISAGPMPLEDAVTNWPTQFVSAQVAVSEIQVI